VVLLEVVFEMFALVFEYPDLFHKMVELRTGRALLLPVGDIDLILTLGVGLNLYVLVHAVGIALLQFLRHLNLTVYYFNIRYDEN
jgi:hypothetical protein